MKHALAKPKMAAITEDLMEPFSQMEHVFANQKMAAIIEYVVERLISDGACLC